MLTCLVLLVWQEMESELPRTITLQNGDAVKWKATSSEFVITDASENFWGPRAKSRGSGAISYHTHVGGVPSSINLNRPTTSSSQLYLTSILKELGQAQTDFDKHDLLLRQVFRAVAWQRQEANSLAKTGS